MRKLHHPPFNISVLADEVENDGIAVIVSNTSHQRQAGQEVIEALSARAVTARSVEAGAPNFVHCIYNSDEMTSSEAQSIGQSLDIEDL
ncbi:hypothetical protein [Chromobacterium violaceum]|uniref:hypothetical protein n=1 Tax=Chromobacterium violaceum TaxID=536 RepID=UPI0005BC7E8E|nr:hypothetical protein [Chromobacterium violaceum]